MIKYLLQGLLFGLAYVTPIGTQNLYVINTAIQKSKLKTYQMDKCDLWSNINTLWS